MAIKVKNPIPKPKYKPGVHFRHIDSEEVFKLLEVRFDTYVLISKKGMEKGESLFTLEYDYELLPEGETLFYGQGKE